MSDREPLPSPKVEDSAVATARRNAELLDDSPRRIPSSEPVLAPPQPIEEPAVSPSRNWDRLTYGGIGGWFKRLFSSSKRATHRAEVAERRNAWNRDLEGMRNDPEHRPDISLLKSNWAARKLRDRQSRMNINRRNLALLEASPQVIAGMRAEHQVTQKLAYLREHVNEVDDAAIDPGPSAQRPTPASGILKRTPAGVSQRNLTEAEREQLTDFESRHQDASRREEEAWEAVPNRDAFNDSWLKKPAEMTQADQTPENLAYIDAVKRSKHVNDTNQRVAAKLSHLDQGDLAFPEQVARQRQGREQALAFHQGYWKREQQAPKPTTKASHDRRVRFAEGNPVVEPFLNTPGNMPDEGEVVNLDAAGNPAQGRILPTGAYEYPAADPGMYGGESAAMRTQFNRRMAENPEYLAGAANDEDPTFSRWAQLLSGFRSRPSMSAKSRRRAGQDGLGAAESARLAAQGERYHMTRDEGLIEPQANVDIRSESGSSQADGESNEALRSEDANPGSQISEDQ